MTATRALVERLNTDAAYLRHRAHETLRTIGNDCEEAATAISALEAALAEARQSWREAVDMYQLEAARSAPAIAAMRAAEAERDRLKEALRPFAEAAGTIDDTESDRIEMWEHPASMEVTAADFRRAARALQGSAKQ